MHPAILLLEFESIAVGIVAGDAMAKRAQLVSLHTGTVQPGKIPGAGGWRGRACGGGEDGWAGARQECPDR